MCDSLGEIRQTGLHKKQPFLKRNYTLCCLGERTQPGSQHNSQHSLKRICTFCPSGERTQTGPRNKSLHKTFVYVCLCLDESKHAGSRNKLKPFLERVLRFAAQVNPDKHNPQASPDTSKNNCVCAFARVDTDTQEPKTNPNTS